jgi:hypothetical protein
MYGRRGTLFGHGLTELVRNRLFLSRRDIRQVHASSATTSHVLINRVLGVLRLLSLRLLLLVELMLELLAASFLRYLWLLLRIIFD